MQSDAGQLPGIPCFQILPDGRLRAISIKRPWEQFQKAVAIMQHGLRFECGNAGTHIELFVMDRQTDKRFPRPLMLEQVANTPSAVRAGLDRLIDRFFVTIGGVLPPDMRKH